MEEPPSNSSSETDLTESWTLVNDGDSERENSNADIEETSDSESLEVLEIEQAEPEQAFMEEEQMRAENNCGEIYTSTDSDYSYVTDIPIFHVAAVKKVRKYVHHPNPFINMWLSVVMVIAIAITLGLGIGHYFGSKRFSKTKDIIYNLRYENQMLGQELAQINTKYNYCEKSLQERVRCTDERVTRYKFLDNFDCKNYYLQGKMYGNLINKSDEVNECPVKESILNMRSFRECILNEISPVFSKCLDHFDGDYTGCTGQIIEHVFCPTNITYFSSKHVQGDASVVCLHSLFSKVGENFNKIQTTDHFSKLKSDITLLHFFISKWNNFIDENMKVHAAIYRDKHLVGQHQLVQLPNEIAHTIVSQINGSSNQFTNVSNTIGVMLSSNSCCKSNFKQCSLQNDKREFKVAKCKTLQSTQIFFAHVKADLHKLPKIFIGASRNAHGKNSTKSQIPKLLLVKKRKKYVNAWSAGHLKEHASKQKNITSSQLHMTEKKIIFFERRKENAYKKFKMCSNNNKQKYYRNSQYFSDGNKEKSVCSGIQNYKSRMHKFNIFMVNTGKNKHNKYKYFVNRPNAKKEKKHHYSRKRDQRDSFKRLKNQHPKLFEKAYKQYRKYNERDFWKNEDNMKKAFYIKKGHSSESKYVKNKYKNNVKPYTKYYKEKDFHKFSHHESKTVEDKSHYINYNFNFFLTPTQKDKRNDGGKRTTNENKTYLDASKVHNREKFAQKHWKERNKIYQVNIKSMNVLKS